MKRFFQAAWGGLCKVGRVINGHDRSVCDVIHAEAARKAVDQDRTKGLP